MDLSFLPLVNACLNGLALVLLLVGFAFIRAKRIGAHRTAMLAAFTTSGLFLVTYVTHYVWRAAVKGGTHTKYNGEGLLAGFYYGMLISHIILAIAVPILAIMLIRLGLTKRYEAHKKIARYAFPIWVYVSITGVLIYLMLYPLNPPPATP
jgi:uncharacterized membrane protein YozB (DUF420 family)